MMEASYDTRLPVVASNSSSVEVALLDGRHGYVLRKNVALHATHATWSPTGRQVIAEARKFVGLQYLWGGTSGFGYDCSGFAYSVFHVLGVTIPRDAAPQATKGVPVLRLNLKPGDLVFFRDGSGVVVHVAIFYGSIKGVPSVIHAPNTGLPVSITPLSSWSSSSYAGARRYVS
jgi:cell wall-associated NlpC family hydrolase